MSRRRSRLLRVGVHVVDVDGEVELVAFEGVMVAVARVIVIVFVSFTQ